MHRSFLHIVSLPSSGLKFFFLGLLVKPSCLIPRIKKWLEPIWRHLEKIVTFGRIDMFDFFGGSLPDPKTNHL